MLREQRFANAAGDGIDLTDEDMRYRIYHRISFPAQPSKPPPTTSVLRLLAMFLSWLVAALIFAIQLQG